jgi:hypothetical protein
MTLPLCNKCNVPTPKRNIGRSDGICSKCRKLLTEEREAAYNRTREDYLTTNLSSHACAEKHEISHTGFRQWLIRNKIVLTPEQRSMKKRGRPLSEETRRKIGEARKKSAVEFLQLPLPITKRCNFCKQVKQAGKDGEFYVRYGRTVDPETGERSLLLDSFCKQCSRALEAKRRREMTPEARRKSNRKKREQVIAKHGIERVREYKRFMKQKEREGKGQDRSFARGKLGRESPGVRAGEQLPLEPFQKWILERCAYYAKRNHIDVLRPGEVAGLAALSRACHITDRSLRRFLDGGEIDKDSEWREISTVSMATVDSCLTNEGSTFLFELYPDEYDLDSYSNEDTPLAISA